MFHRFFFARILLSALLFVPTFTFAKSIVKAAVPDDPTCQNFDLNESPQSPFRLIPMYDQGNAGICYAYAASQMIDYVRIKAGDTKSGFTHPTYAAWVYKYKTDVQAREHELAGGSPYYTINVLRTEGSCAYGEVDARLSVLTRSSTGMTNTQLVDLLDKIAIAPQPSTLRRGLNSVLGIEPSCIDNHNLERQLRRYNLFGIAAPSVLAPLFRDCKLVPVNVPPAIYHTNSNDTELANHLAQNLSQSLPVTINYCANVLDNSQARSAMRVYETSLREPRSDCSKHASLVTAQTNLGGKCQYLIRNSYGPQNKDRAATQCACITTNGAYEKFCTQKTPREFVGCWHSREAILANSYGLTSFR